jgi:hypothetical protein
MASEAASIVRELLKDKGTRRPIIITAWLLPPLAIGMAIAFGYFKFLREDAAPTDRHSRGASTETAAGPFGHCFKNQTTQEQINCVAARLKEITPPSNADRVLEIIALSAYSPCRDVVSVETLHECVTKISDSIKGPTPDKGPPTSPRNSTVQQNTNQGNGARASAQNRGNPSGTGPECDSIAPPKWCPPQLRPGNGGSGSPGSSVPNSAFAPR